MKIDIKDLPESKKEIVIELSQEELKGYTRKATLDLSRGQKIEGFRPGKAPQKIVEQKVGSKRLLERTIDIAIKESYVQTLLENKIETIEEPKIEVRKMVPGELLVFKAEVSVLPSVKLGDYSQLSVEPSIVKVEDKEIDAALATLQKSRAKYKTVLRPAQKGDRVEIDFSSKVGEKNIEGGTSKQHPLIIGEGHFMRGFEEELVGLKETEKKTFSLLAPKDYYQKELSGKKIEFAVTMNLVQEVEMPKLDDIFAKGLGKFATLADLKKNISEGLEEEKQNREKEKKRLEIIDLIVAGSTFQVPEKLVTIEIEKMEQEFTASLARMNLQKDSYLAHIKKSIEDLRTEWQDQAEKRVGASLVLREVATQEKISIEETEIEERANKILEGATNTEQVKNIDPVRLKEHVKAMLQNEKVFELLENRMIK